MKQKYRVQQIDYPSGWSYAAHLDNLVAFSFSPEQHIVNHI